MSFDWRGERKILCACVYMCECRKSYLEEIEEERRILEKWDQNIFWDREEKRRLMYPLFFWAKYFGGKMRAKISLGLKKKKKELLEKGDKNIFWNKEGKGKIEVSFVVAYI